MKPRVLFVGGTRYRLPLSPALARKWDALAEELDLRVLARSAEHGHAGDDTFALVGPVRPGLLDGPLFFTSLPFRIAREARRFRPQAIVAQGPHEAAAALIGRKLARSRAAVVLELHGDWRASTRLYGSPLRRLLEPVTEPIASTAVRRADALRTISGFTTGLLRPLGREPAAVFPAYVDLSTFLERPPAPLPERPAAVFVAVLERYKGVDVLDEAWRETARRVPDATLRIVGSGPETASIEQLVEAVPDRTSWTPELDPVGVSAALDEATVLVLPSRSEGLPRIVIEAFCRARPVVGARVGGIPDIVEDGVSGLLVPPEDPGALTEALVKLLGDRELQERLSAGARAAAEPWSQTPEEFARHTRRLIQAATS